LLRCPRLPNWISGRAGKKDGMGEEKGGEERGMERRGYGEGIYGK